MAAGVTDAAQGNGPAVEHVALARYRRSLARMADWLGRRVLKSRSLPSLPFLLTQWATAADVAIVPERAAHLYGVTFVHLAVCRGPKP